MAVTKTSIKNQTPKVDTWRRVTGGLEKNNLLVFIPTINSNFPNNLEQKVSNS